MKLKKAIKVLEKHKELSEDFGFNQTTRAIDRVLKECRLTKKEIKKLCDKAKPLKTDFIHPNTRFTVETENTVIHKNPESIKINLPVSHD